MNFTIYPKLKYIYNLNNKFLVQPSMLSASVFSAIADSIIKSNSKLDKLDIYNKLVKLNAEVVSHVEGNKVSKNLSKVGKYHITNFNDVELAGFIYGYIKMIEIWFEEKLHESLICFLLISKLKKLKKILNSKEFLYSSKMIYHFDKDSFELQEMIKDLDYLNTNRGHRFDFDYWFNSITVDVNSL